MSDTATIPSPTISSVATNPVEQGQTTVIGTVMPGLPGDTLILTQTKGTGTLSLGAVQADGTQQVIYTAPASVPASTIDSVQYTIGENGQTTTGPASVQLDAGPSVTSQALPAVEQGQITVIGTVKPGLPRDTITLQQTAGAGTLSLGPVQNDGTQQVIYTAPASVTASTMDAVAYTVSDQHDDVIVSENQNVLVDPGLPPTASELPSGAVAWWTFNNVNGALALDSVGNNNGVVVGATPTPGEVGGGLAFNGVSDFVSVPNSSTWNFGSGDFSVDLWANFAAAPTGVFFILAMCSYHMTTVQVPRTSGSSLRVVEPSRSSCTTRVMERSSSKAHLSTRLSGNGTISLSSNPAHCTHST